MPVSRGGALEIIDRCKPALMIEIEDPIDPEYADAFTLYRLLSERGYRAFLCDGQHIRPWRLGIKGLNYFFLTPEHAELLSSDTLTWSDST